MLIKLNIVKFAKLIENKWFLSVENTKYKLIKISKPTENTSINKEELNKLNSKSKCLLILSTNNGVVTNHEAAKSSSGGLIIAAVIKKIN